MRLDIVTIFPEYFAPLEISLLGKARRAGLLDVHVHDLREWTRDRHRTVDDTPYGGGPGMVMKPDPWGEALDTLFPPPSAPAETPTPPPGGPQPERVPPGWSPPDAPLPREMPSHHPSPSAPPSDRPSPGGPSSERPSLGGVSSERPSSGEAVGAGSQGSAGAGAGEVPRLIIPTPSGRPFTQADAVRYAAEPWLVFACGRYEGIDSRVAEEARTRMPVNEVSLGDFVLAGGEVAVLVMVEAIGRLLPGVLGNADSIADDSFAPGAMESLLEGPVYTKPPVWRGRPVPDILLSGHHGAIARWRRDEALRRTARHRPELLDRLDREVLDKHDRAVLREAGFPVDGEDMAD
ncbi:tRNA (guanine(37)-N(1))-methyltransferase [Spirillospora sp. CA-142024]|uniref:tRNA (guanine(37)-N(1))-methyltransferase n=1 Tax=Spirillospora sp. CA-142024 TaxID=3240036 RepID=UPI003D942EDF